MKRFKDTDYYVSMDGKVYSKKRTTTIELKQYTSINGYKYVSLRIDDKYKIHLIHRMVAECFLSNWSKELQVNHIDLNKENNHISNLEQMTCDENIKHYLKSKGTRTYKIEVYKNPLLTHHIFDTWKEASLFMGYKSRGCISKKLLDGTQKNRKGFFCKRLYT